jgi:hypothetical protein
MLLVRSLAPHIGRALVGAVRPTHTLGRFTHSRRKRTRSCSRMLRSESLLASTVPWYCCCSCRRTALASSSSAASAASRALTSLTTSLRLLIYDTSAEHVKMLEQAYTAGLNAVAPETNPQTVSLPAHLDTRATLPWQGSSSPGAGLDSDLPLPSDIVSFLLQRIEVCCRPHDLDLRRLLGAVHFCQLLLLRCNLQATRTAMASWTARLPLRLVLTW